MRMEGLVLFCKDKKSAKCVHWQGEKSDNSGTSSTRMHELSSCFLVYGEKR